MDDFRGVREGPVHASGNAMGFAQPEARHRESCGSWSCAATPTSRGADRLMRSGRRESATSLAAKYSIERTSCTYTQIYIVYIYIYQAGALCAAVCAAVCAASYVQPYAHGTVWPGIWFVHVKGCLCARCLYCNPSNIFLVPTARR